MLDFRILGPVEVVDGDRRFALGGPRQRALLVILVLRCGEAVSSDRLIEELWGERPPATAAKIVQGYVSTLRKVLGDGTLVTRGGGYQLAAAPEQIDAERFAYLVADAREVRDSGDFERARDHLAAALALWRGEALADLAYEECVQDDITRLTEERLAALEDRIDADLALGDHHEIVAELEVLTRRHPNRERLLAQLMVALYRSGRQSDALEAYRRGTRALRDELGLEPGHELRALEREILEQDPALGVPVASARAATARSPPRGAAPAGRTRRRWLLPVGGVLLLAAAIAAAVTQMAGGHGPSVRVSANSIAGIGVRSDRVEAVTPVGNDPGAIAFGSGSLWVANYDGQSISRVNPHTLDTLVTIPLQQPPTGIATADGAVWAVTSNATQNFVDADQIDPRFDTVDRRRRVGNVDTSTATAVAAARDSVWVAPFAGYLTTLNSGTGAVIHRVDPDTAPSAIALGDGAAWLASSQTNSIIRIDPTGLRTTIGVGNDPNGIAVGDGGVWVADTGDNKLMRIDPNTGSVLTTIPVGDDPRGVTVGGGSVWVANSGDGTVSRVDPHTDLVAATISVGGSPQTITVADGRAWVTVDAAALPRSVAASGGTLRVDANLDVDSLDPAIAYEPLSAQVLGATCTMLLNYPDKSGAAGTQLIPEVARTLPVISDGGRTYTFTIRRGYRFAPPSNEPVTAQTFKDTIERTLNPKMKSPALNEFNNVVGAETYIEGKASHISGVVVDGDRLIVRLREPEPVLSNLLAQSFFCAVPPDTPIDPAGVRVIPSAGPYTTASYTPGQGIVLVRNPNYHGDRPHHFARIDVAVDVPSARAVTAVESGRADYAIDGAINASDAPALSARYGPGSPAAKAGHQQYFVNAYPQINFFTLNTHRSLFSHRRLREAVNYALNRVALARLGDMHSTMPVVPAEGYLPPGIPGQRDIKGFPLTSDLAKARRLARGFGGSTVVLYTCDHLNCEEQAQIIKSELAAIGLRVKVNTLAPSALYSEYALPHGAWDMGPAWWLDDYPDPQDFFNLLLETNLFAPAFKDPGMRTKLAAAARLQGVDRYLTYGRLDQELTVAAAPWVVYGYGSSHTLFSARIGCQSFTPVGMDLAALCVRKKAH